jgi:hypothetical protein
MGVRLAYCYDVFFSYKRDPETDIWHETVKEKLRLWLRMDLNQDDVAIFFDTEDIKTGQRWRTKLEAALKGSKCAVCIWSPLYFKSKWCMSEWMTFEQRGRNLGADLVVPARFHDGEHYPQAAKDRQSRDFSRYASIMPRFWQTERAVEFEDVLRPFSRDLADAIRNAPPYRADFPLVEAADDLILKSKPIGRPSDNG